MKRAKRSFELEEKELDYSKELGIELDDEQDDEIIELDDIVELPDGSEDDDLSLDVELLDVDSDLDLSDLDEKLKGSGGDSFLDEDLLKGFSFGESEEKAPPPAAPPEQDGGILGQNSVDDLLKDFAFADEASSKFDASSEGGLLEADSNDSDFDSFMDLDKDLFSEPERALRPIAAEEPKIVVPPVAGVAAAAIEDGPSGLDEFVTRIEAGLEEKIREIVESRLPDIVRTILREEIEKLKREF